MAGRPDHIQKLSLLISANTQKLQGQMKQLNGRMNRMNKGAQMMQQHLAGAFSVVAVVALGRKLIQLRMEFEKTMGRVKALTGASKELTKALENQALELGKSTVFTANEAAQAMTYLAQAGLEVSEVSKALPGVLQLAAAGQIELAEAADIATNVLAAYGLKAKDLTKVNDILANVQANANTNILEFAEAFKIAGPAARATGEDIKDISASIGVLANAGIKATLGGTALRGMIAQLQKVTPQAAKAFEKLGISLTDIKGKPLHEVLALLNEKGANAGDMIDIFGKRFFTAADVISNNISTFTGLRTELDEIGTSAEMAAIQLDNLAGDWKLLTSALEGLGQTASGEAVNPIRGATKEMTGFVGMVERAIKGLSRLSGIAAAMGGNLATWEALTYAAQVSSNAAAGLYGSGTGGDPFNPAPVPARPLPKGFNPDKGDPVEVISRLNTQLKELVGLGSQLREFPPLEAVTNPEFIENLGLTAEQIGILKNRLLELNEDQLGGWVSLAEIVGRIANGIANARDNWAAMGAAITSGVAQMIPQIQKLIKASQELALIKKSEAISSGVASASSVPFPGNLVAIATTVATILATLAPFVGKKGSYAIGSNYVPQTGMYQLHAGEKVTSKYGGKKQQLVAQVAGEDLHFVLTEYNRKRG